MAQIHDPKLRPPKQLANGPDLYVETITCLIPACIKDFGTRHFSRTGRITDELIVPARKQKIRSQMHAVGFPDNLPGLPTSPTAERDAIQAAAFAASIRVVAGAANKP